MLRDFRLQDFFMNEFQNPKALSIPSWSFRIFSKIRGDIRSSRCTTGVVDIGGKWKKSSIRNVLMNWNYSMGSRNIAEDA
jgi:hypothetical protein